MGESQVVGVGGTQPLRNVLGEALKGRFSFELENFSFFLELRSFRRVLFFPVLLQDLAPNLRAMELLVSTMSWRSF